MLVEYLGRGLIYRGFAGPNSGSAVEWAVCVKREQASGDSQQ